MARIGSAPPARPASRPFEPFFSLTFSAAAVRLEAGPGQGGRGHAVIPAVRAGLPTAGPQGYDGGRAGRALRSLAPHHLPGRGHPGPGGYPHLRRAGQGRRHPAHRAVRPQQVGALRRGAPQPSGRPAGHGGRGARRRGVGAGQALRPLRRGGGGLAPGGLLRLEPRQPADRPLPAAQGGHFPPGGPHLPLQRRGGRHRGP